MFVDAVDGIVVITIAEGRRVASMDVGTTTFDFFACKSAAFTIVWNCVVVPEVFVNRKVTLFEAEEIDFAIVTGISFI